MKQIFISVNFDFFSVNRDHCERAVHLHIEFFKQAILVHSLTFTQTTDATNSRVTEQ